MIMQQLLTSIDRSGLLAEHIDPLMARMDSLLGTQAQSAANLGRRFRILSVTQRPVHLEHFALVGSAVSVVKSHKCNCSNMCLKIGLRFSHFAAVFENHTRMLGLKVFHANIETQ